jgi:valyl-tRNA synthetase
MNLPELYKPAEMEPLIQEFWRNTGVYHFSPQEQGPVFAIDTPPPTVSGTLHLGHMFSYTHADLIARQRRMKGYQVFYPMGYDDNGLPTERLVEKQLGIKVEQVGRRTFIEHCLQIGEQAERDYQALWQRLGLSIDWRFTYRTIGVQAQRISQKSFIDLYKQGLAYRQKSPSIWCPECQTTIAQAELNDLERTVETYFLAFRLDDGKTLPIATTRPELLPACVAIFVHPDAVRFKNEVGAQATIPLIDRQVPILEDLLADPEKGSGVVMCCTFGDSTDIHWWRTHQLPLIELIQPDGTLGETAGDFAGLSTSAARRQIVSALEQAGLLLDRQSTPQSVRVHERCDTPVEHILASQWFLRVLEFKERLLQAGEQLTWHPLHMKARYRSWVENLSWDWCLSRQRTFGVPFPLWYCQECGEVMIAAEDQLPVDPVDTALDQSCSCGSDSFLPERDVMDTWATSSMSPQIVGRWLADPQLYQRVFPMSLRPQGHEIIRTWAFYTLYKSLMHFDRLPWKDVVLSGWGIAAQGMGKISKSRGTDVLQPSEAIENYSADAVRYWAASTGVGKDTVISEEKIKTGARLITKLWNVARFAERFLIDFRVDAYPPPLSPADRWILSRIQNQVTRVSELFEGYDYATAKSELENFFWRDLADNYLEMAKQRLYNETHPLHHAARYTLYNVLLTTIKLFAPFTPHITEAIYQAIFLHEDWLEEARKGNWPGGVGWKSIHTSRWPEPDVSLQDEQAEQIGEYLIEIASAVRRYKSENNLSLRTELNRLQLSVKEPHLAVAFQDASSDLMSITRAKRVDVVAEMDAGMLSLGLAGEVGAAITPVE